MTLKELRVYHWNAAVRARADADFHSERKGMDARVMFKAMTGRAEWHMAAVQALNDVVPGSAGVDSFEAYQLKFSEGVTGARPTCVIIDDPLKGE